MPPHRAHHRPIAFRLLRAALPGAALATGGVALSVAVVRRAAAGHLYGERDVPAAPVALVLGARVFADGTPSPFLAARLDLAHRLWAAGSVDVLLLSGDSLAPEFDEPEAMRRHLVAAGVPETAIVLDHAGFDTYDSCVRASRVYGVRALTVVTQGYHLPRAVATARLLGLEACGVGDESARRYRRSWRRGLLRDQVACVKTVVDLVTSRRPLLGATDPAVTRALARSTRRATV